MAQTKNFNIKAKIKPALKITGLAILGIIVVYIAFVFIGSLIGSMSGSRGFQYGGYSSAPEEISDSKSMSMPGAAPAMDMADDSIMSSLSTRNVTSSGSAQYYGGGMSSGDTAEEFEMIQYRAQIETRQVQNTCAAVAGLKSREDVIFESASEYDKGCNYGFKVKRASADAILAKLKDLKPKELTSSTYTIQQQVQDYTSEIEILQNKLAVIDDTLTKAMAAYDEVTKLATSVKDAESLASVINNKINTIEQLTQQRLSVNAQMDQIQRSKTQQLDRLDYTYFNVSVTDNSLIDIKSIKDSWNLAVKSAVNKINETIQNISISLVAFLFILLQWIVYAFILLFVAKYSWKLVRAIWKK